MDTVTKEKIRTGDLMIVEKPVSATYYSPEYMVTAGYHLHVKRFCDVVVSALLIVCVLSWLYPIVALLINLSSRGGALFIQKRIGLNGREFKCYKFRSMVVNKESDFVGAAWNDTRITGIGRWLRATYIDELPQLLNVLKGDMSIVGPRPHMLYHHRKFAADVPFYEQRHNVKPGITGLAQVKGYHGYITNNHHLQSRTRLDLFYVKKISFSLDIMILIKTVFALFSTNKTLHR